MIKIEDSLYLSLYNQLRDSREVLKYLEKNPCEGYEVVDYIFSYTPLPYQVL